MKRGTVRPGKHQALIHGLRFYELKRIRKIVLFVRQRLDRGNKNPIPVTELSIIMASLDEIRDALGRVCRTRNLKVVIFNGLIIFYRKPSRRAHE
jgi:hypothetical protein